MLVELDPERGTIEFKAIQHVVSEVVDRDKEISVEDAQELNPAYKEGDEIVRTFVPKDFGRIAAQTAKQVILQKLHETERDNTFSAFSDKEGELMEGVVRKLDDRNVYVELSEKKIEGVMLPQDQTPTERYVPGDRLKVFVKRVKNSGKNSQILVSRAAPGLVKKLFEEQVPEIAQGIVEIKAISREPGHRTKMAICSNDNRVDAVGACVGNKGSRVNAVVEELGGEKIDIILWSENPLEFIAKALSPAAVISVTQTNEKGAVAVVPDDKLSLANRQGRPECPPRRAAYGLENRRQEPFRRREDESFRKRGGRGRRRKRGPPWKRKLKRRERSAKRRKKSPLFPRKNPSRRRTNLPKTRKKKANNGKDEIRPRQNVHRLPRDEAEKGYASDREERRRGNQIGFFGKSSGQGRVYLQQRGMYRKAQKAETSP